MCILALCFYKYTRFASLQIVGAINPDWGREVNEWTGVLLPEMPPLAISFFTFEFVHYLHDVLRGRASIRSPLQFSLFAIFWPSLVAGPIKRYEQFLPALERGLSAPASWLFKQKLAPGLLQISVGYVKKSISDNLTVFIDAEIGSFTT